MRVRNYIYAPVKNEGYRPFTDAPPSVTNILQDTIAHLKPGTTAQYSVLKAVDTQSNDDIQRHRDFYAKNLVLAMYKYSSQKDQYDREGLRFYHVVVLEHAASRPYLDIFKRKPELAFTSVYGDDSNEQIEHLLSYASKEPTEPIDDIFREYFIDAEMLKPGSDVDYKSGKHLSVKPAKKSSSGAIAPLSSEFRAQDLVDVINDLRQEIKGVRHLLLLIVTPLLLAITVVVAYSTFFLITTIKSAPKPNPMPVPPISPVPAPSSIVLEDMSTHADIASTFVDMSTKAPTVPDDLGLITRDFRPSVITAQALHDKYIGNGNCIVIDSNSYEHYRMNHIPRAIHYGTDRKLVDTMISGSDKGTDFVFYGDGAYNIAIQYGLKNPQLKIHFLNRGFLGWSNSGFPAEP